MCRNRANGHVLAFLGFLWLQVVNTFLHMHGLFSPLSLSLSLSLSLLSVALGCVGRPAAHEARRQGPGLHAVPLAPVFVVLVYLHRVNCLLLCAHVFAFSSSLFCPSQSYSLIVACVRTAPCHGGNAALFTPPPSLSTHRKNTNKTNQPAYVLKLDTKTNRPLPPPPPPPPPPLYLKQIPRGHLKVGPGLAFLRHKGNGHVLHVLAAQGLDDGLAGQDPARLPLDVVRIGESKAPPVDA